MTPFVRIFTDMYPVTRIERVELSALIDGVPGVEVKLINTPGSFTYTEGYAEAAYNALMAFVPAYLLRVGDALIPATIINIGKDVITVDDIVWVNLNANFNGNSGVEIGVITVMEGTPQLVVKQYVGENASIAYNLLTQFVPDVAASSSAS